jgi:hypothetical protein
VVLEKDGKGQLDRSCEKLSIAHSQGEQQYLENNEKKEG